MRFKFTLLPWKIVHFQLKVKDDHSMSMTSTGDDAEEIRELSFNRDTIYKGL